MLDIIPLIKIQGGVTYELLGYSAFTGKIKVRSLEHGYEKVVHLTETILEDRTWVKRS